MGTETQHQFVDIDNDDDADYEDLETAYGTFPPGEEALLQSHEGGEAIFQQIFDNLKYIYLILTFTASTDFSFGFNRRTDARIRTERVQIAVDKWRSQMPLLVDVYLHYKACGTIQSQDNYSWPLTVLSFTGTS
jgi:hypothetical protein